MRQRLVSDSRQRWLPVAVLSGMMVAGLLLLSGCAGSPAGTSPAPGSNEGPETGVTGADGSEVSWQVEPLETLSEQQAAWVEEHRSQLGIFQKVFGDRSLIMVSWGEKETGGYAVSVDAVRQLEDGRLELTVQLKEPDPDEMVTQAFTYPYALISVKAGEPYELKPRFEGAPFYQNKAFEIERPGPFVRVEDSLRVTGKARVFEGSFQMILEDGHRVLAEKVMQVEGAPAWSQFDVELLLEETPSSPNGTLLLYEESAKDGSEVNRIVIPVRFADWE